MREITKEDRDNIAGMVIGWIESADEEEAKQLLKLVLVAIFFALCVIAWGVWWLVKDIREFINDNYL